MCIIRVKHRKEHTSVKIIRTPLRQNTAQIRTHYCVLPGPQAQQSCRAVCVCVCVFRCDSLLVTVGGVGPLLISRVALLVTSQEPRGSETQSSLKFSGTTFCRIHSTLWLPTSKAAVFSILSTQAVSFFM